MATIAITEYTDPGCPYAFSAEPARRRLQWLYGEGIEWRRRMVVLSESPDDYLERGFTPEKQAASLARLQREHGMPIDPLERPRMAATEPACRAVVAARLRAPEHEVPLLRRLRVLAMAGALLDEPETIATAARESGIDPGELFSWMEEDAVAEELERDKEAARNPSRAAEALEHKLAEEDTGHRYTCPSYEIAGPRGSRIDVPGFQPFEAYEAAIANLAPDLERRDEPHDVGEVLEWAGEPLATAEVAAVCGIELAEAREQLARVATEEPMGAEGVWDAVSAEGLFA
jgi:2-hydroxychromene-2-carboxylate isomerase